MAPIIYSLLKIVETRESDFTCPLQCSHAYKNLKIKSAESCGYVEKQILINKTGAYIVASQRCLGRAVAAGAGTLVVIKIQCNL
jgi:hypothetical protein